MVTHVPPPATYSGGWPDSPLTERDRQQLRTIVRQLRRGHIDSCDLALDSCPAIETLALSYTPVDTGVSLDVYLVEDALDIDITANERCDAGGLITLNDDPHLLRDLGQCWYQLEADLLAQLVTVLDLPTTVEDLLPHTIPPLGLRCTTAHTGSLACFASIFFACSDAHPNEPVE